MKLRAAWRTFQANKWARSHENGKRLQYTLHLYKTGDPRGTERLGDFRAEFQKAMLHMWTAQPAAAAILNASDASPGIIGEMFDKAEKKYCDRTPPNFIPYATTLGDIWDHVSSQVAELLQHLAGIVDKTNRAFEKDLEELNRELDEDDGED